MSENTLNWVIVFVLLLVGFGAGWVVFDPDEEPVTADRGLAAQCWREFDGYVRDQVDWLQKHNEELRSISELQEHNKEVTDAAVENK